MIYLKLSPFIKFIKGISLLYVPIIFLFAIVDAVKLGMIRLVLSTWVANRPPLIFYCLFSSHLQNVSPIISELNNRKFPMIVILGFHPSDNVIKELGLKKVWTINNSRVLALMRSGLFITPVVGLDRLRMPWFGKVVHFLVSLTSLDGVYPDSHFDSFDYIVCAGKYHIGEFGRLASRRNMSGKILITGGYPKLDSQLIWLDNKRSSITAPSAVQTVIYAPTHDVSAVNEDLTSLKRHGGKIVEKLITAGLNVIFRPHPQSFGTDEESIIQDICNRHSMNSHFSLDRSLNYMEAYAKADLIVTDVSGTGFTFAFTFLRPAVYFSPNITAEIGLQGIQYDSREQIGAVVRDIDSLVTSVSALLGDCENLPSKIRQFRDSQLYNVGATANYFCDRIPLIMKKQKSPEWVEL